VSWLPDRCGSPAFPGLFALVARMRGHFPVTVAGPRRTRTGFLAHPRSGSPASSHPDGLRTKYGNGRLARMPSARTVASPGEQAKLEQSTRRHRQSTRRCLTSKPAEQSTHPAGRSTRPGQQPTRRLAASRVDLNSQLPSAGGRLARRGQSTRPQQTGGRQLAASRVDLKGRHASCEQSTRPAQGSTRPCGPSTRPSVRAAT
jgi:hypothetical protein